MTLLAVFSLLFIPSSLAGVNSVVKDLNNANIESCGPDSEVFKAAKLSYNARFSFEPAAIAYPQNEEQVSAVVKIGVKNGLNVAARSGGHSYIANGLGGGNGSLVLDLSLMKKILYNSSTERTTIETGNRLGEVAFNLNNLGRAIPHGTCPYVGIGGHAAFGGFGHASRMWGLTLDNIESLRVVLANGTIATASPTCNEDLFWAMRGAAPSFGITTSIEFRTYPVPEEAYVYHINWNLAPHEAARAIRAFQTFSTTSNIPKELSAYFYLSKSSTPGLLYLELTGGWYGPRDLLYWTDCETGKLDGVLGPWLEMMPQPAHERFDGNGSWIDALSVNTAEKTVITQTVDLQAGETEFYAKSLMVPENEPLSEKALQALTQYLDSNRTSMEGDWWILFELFGGKDSAINKVPVEQTAFARRDTLWTIQLYISVPSSRTLPQSGYEFLDGAVNTLIFHMPRSWNYGGYMNYVDDRLAESGGRKNETDLYYSAHYSRLQQIKASIDPNNVFGFPTAVQGH